MRAWFQLQVLVALGLIWLIVDRVLVWRYPSAWGGPNIGGGFLVALALLTVVVCAALIGVRLVRRNPSVRTPQAVFPLLFNGLLLLGVGVVRVVAPDITEGGLGQVGVTVSDTGSPVLVLQVCRDSVDTISLFGPNDARHPNERLGTLRTTSPVISGADVDLAQPPPRWTGGPVSLLRDTRPELLVIAVASGAQSELRQVTFTEQDLKSLTPSTVRYTTYDATTHGDVAKTVAAKDFRAVACPTS